MLTYILGALGVLAAIIVAILAVASRRPDTFRVVRSASIQAPPDKIYSLIADFRQWKSWSPFERDPNMKRDIAGAPGSIGHAYAWDGNKNVGAGTMMLAEAAEPQRVMLKLNFLRPFKASNTVVFTLLPQAGGATEVSWDMHGPVPLFGKVIHMFMDMDKMCGDDFAKGLANLKALAEKP